MILLMLLLYLLFVILHQIVIPLIADPLPCSRS